MYFCPKLQPEILQTTWSISLKWQKSSQQANKWRVIWRLILAIIASPWDSQFPLNFVKCQKLPQQSSLMSKTNLHWHFGEEKKNYAINLLFKDVLRQLFSPSKQHSHQELYRSTGTFCIFNKIV